MSRPANHVSGTDTVERILATAEAMFAEHGFDAVSINAIAVQAGVSKANVFHHFSSKNELYVAVLRCACADAAAQLDRLGGTDGPLPQRLRRFAGEHLGHLLEKEHVSRLILRELLKDSVHHGQQLAEQVFGDRFGRLVQILRGAQQAKELRQDIDPAMLATILIGANVFFFEARDILRHLPEVEFGAQPERYTAMLTDILLNGVLPKTAEPTTTRTPTRTPS